MGLRLLVALGLGGCASAPPSPEPRSVDDRDQYALLTELRTAEASGSALSAQRVRTNWLGRRYRWEVHVLPALCRPGAPCHALPFDNARLDFVTRQGWLPRLDLDEAQQRTVAQWCERHEGCVIQFEGTLTTFQFAPDEYTRIGFSDVVPLGARPVAAGERWGQRHAADPDRLRTLREWGARQRAKGRVPTIRRMGS